MRLEGIFGVTGLCGNKGVTGETGFNGCGWTGACDGWENRYKGSCGGYTGICEEWRDRCKPREGMAMRFFINIKNFVASCIERRKYYKRMLKYADSVVLSEQHERVLAQEMASVNLRRYNTVIDMNQCSEMARFALKKEIDELKVAANLSRMRIEELMEKLNRGA